MWVFDDERVGLHQEPLTCGTDEIIDRMVRDIPCAERGFILVFSSVPFEDGDCVFEWMSGDMDGNWYWSEALNMEGWLCPALLKYFESVPEKIYAQFSPE